MKFKCKTTNLVYSFEHAVDVVSMEKHPDYSVVEEKAVEEPQVTKKTTSKVKDNGNTTSTDS